jgi:hypothetical protein
VRAGGWFGFALAAFDGLNERGQPVGDIQRGGLAGQQVVAQRPQRYRQVGQQLLGRGMGFAFPMAADQRDQPASVGDNIAVPDPTTCIL